MPVTFTQQFRSQTAAALWNTYTGRRAFYVSQALGIGLTFVATHCL